MNDNELRKHFRKSIIICSVLAIIILFIGICVLALINGSWEKIVSEQMERESKDIKERIIRQIEKDQEVLEGLSVFMEGYSTEDMESYSKRFYDANVANSFVSMACFDRDGKGILTNVEYGIKNADYHSLGIDVQEIIEAAYRGETAVSSAFDSVVTDHRIIAYAVPVYNEEQTEVTGVLAASKHIDVFEELAQDNTFDGKGDIHLLSKQGDLLISSYNLESSKGLQTILYSNYFFDYDTQLAIKEAIANDESLFCSMTYEGKSYRVYLYPLGLNDWYLMYLHNQEDIGIAAGNRSRILGCIFAFMFLFVLLSFIYMIRINYVNIKSLIKIAYEDPLTNADNLARFMKNLTKERSSADGFSIVALNIHHFKFINEVLGVEIADDILRFICTCLSKKLQEGEFFCRESSDLFFICLGETDKESIKLRMEHIIREISLKAVPGEKDYRIRMYAGVLIVPKEEVGSLSNEIMLTRTRYAMEYSRRSYDNKIYFYDSNIHSREEMAIYVENRMHQALENGEFHLFLQPKIDLKTGKLGGAEALVRWITPEGKTLLPDLFIPLFEKNGFCIQLDLYMMEQACKQIRVWLDAGVKAIPISVNQSKLLFFDSGYITRLEEIVYKYNVPPNMITLEIIESLMLGHPVEIGRKLSRLRDIGFRISMDDFGSGYSTFNTLGSLEVDELKLDRAFLLEFSQEKGDRYKIILSHIINMTKSLNITTVAEGVETAENEKLIHSLGCDYGQGYLYSRPVNIEDFNKLMKASDYKTGEHST